MLICPGGQAEMCLTNRLHRHKEFSVYSRHKGAGCCGAAMRWGCRRKVWGVVGRVQAVLAAAEVQLLCSWPNHTRPAPIAPVRRICAHGAEARRCAGACAGAGRGRLAAQPDRVARHAALVHQEAGVSQTCVVCRLCACCELACADTEGRAAAALPADMPPCFPSCPPNPPPPRLPARFPIPFIIAGRWCLPLPAPTGLRFVIGQPIRGAKPAKEGDPSEKEVDALHAQFYASLKVRAAAGQQELGSTLVQTGRLPGGGQL